jgi:hypothetical protein
MSHRCLVAAGALASVLAAMLLVAVSVAGQTSQAPQGQSNRAPAAVALDKAKASLGKSYVQPKTAWADPDLQGVWSYATTTPLSRPDGTKDEITDEEAAADEEKASALQDAPPRPGDPGTYNDFWWDRGKKLDRPSLIIDPPDGKLPVKPEAAKARAERAAYQRAHPADSYLDRSPTDRCIIYHGVPPVPSGYSNTYQIVQAPHLVAIYDEEIHHIRLIPLDSRPHLPESVRHWNGDSRGHWEGDTLVVETTNFNDKTALRYQGSSNTRAVERFKRVSADMIDYRYTITDPSVFTRPFTVAIPMPRRTDDIYEYACHEGNHSIVGILAGARAQEKAAEGSPKTRPR